MHSQIWGAVRGLNMDSSGIKKLGVTLIVLLLALYLIGYVILIAVVGLPIEAVVAYGIICFVFLALLTYEAWQRFKEIDEGLEDAVDDY